MSGADSRVPTLDELLGIDLASWRWLVRMARQALHELPPTVEDPRLARLRAAPAKRLVDGRARRDLAALLAQGGAPWGQLLTLLRAATDVPAALGWMLDGSTPEPIEQAGDGPSSADVEALRREVAGLQRRLDKAAQDVHKARARAQERREERDRTATQLRGLEVRLAAVEAEREDALAALAPVRAEVERLQREAGKAEGAATSAVARERRRQEARVTELEAEVSALRRAEQERRVEDAARERREQAQQDRARRAKEAATEESRDETQRSTRRRKVAGPVASAGRPSKVPDQVQEGSTEHSRALLTPLHRLYVDGYNVVKTVRADLTDIQAQRDWLLPRVARVAATHGVEATIFWDGEGAATERVDQDVVQRFCAADVDADDDIVFEVALAATDQPIVVVTDDMGLRRRLAEHHVDLLHSRAFGWVLGV